MRRVDFTYKNTEITLFTHDSPDHIGNLIATNKNFYEIDLLEKTRSLFAEGSAIVDAGANIGNHTVFFAKVLSAPVIAFEPFAPNRDILIRNIAANGCTPLVRVEHAALGNTNSHGTALSANPGNFGMVSIQPDPTGTLPISRLDDALATAIPVSIIKVDVEGSELDVLKGASNILASQKPHLFVEAGQKNEMAGIREFLRRFGYELRGQFCITPTYLFSVPTA